MFHLIGYDKREFSEIYLIGKYQYVQYIDHWQNI